MLDGDPVMRKLVPYRGHDAGLRIPPIDRANPGRAPKGRSCSVRRRNELGLDLPSVRKCRGHTVRGGRNGVDLHWRHETRVGHRTDALDQGTAEHPIFDDVTERGVVLELEMVVVQKQRGTIVGDPDIEDRLSAPSDVCPQPDAVEYVSRTIGDSGGTPIKLLVQHRRGIVAVDNPDHQPGAGASHSEQHPNEPPPAITSSTSSAIEEG